MNRYTFHLATGLRTPTGPVTLAADKILSNDVVLPWESHPHKMRLWIIGHAFEALCAVWATGEQDALDTAVDEDLGDYFLVSKEDIEKETPEEAEEWAHLGNAGEPCDLSDAWIAPVVWNKERDCQLIAAFAEARGANNGTLDF